MFRRIVLLAAIFAGAAIVTAQETTVIGGDESSLRHYIERLQVSSFIQVNEDSESTVYIADVPPNLPVEMPLPDGAQVIGSSYIHSANWVTWKIISDVPLTIEETLAFYDNNLGDTFVVPEQATMFRGFMQGDLVDQQTYCYNGDEYVVYLRAVGLEDGLTGLSIDIQDGSVSGNICDTMGNPAGFGAELYAVLPNLAAPAGTSLQGSGTSSGNNTLSTNAQFFAASDDVTLETMLAQFEAQLMEQGWESAASTLMDTGAWSTWQAAIDDEVYSGYLLVIQNPVNENRFDAQFAMYLHDSDTESQQ